MGTLFVNQEQRPKFLSMMYIVGSGYKLNTDKGQKEVLHMAQYRNLHLP